MSNEPETPILEPGADIKPQIDHEGVKLLAERLYGISVLELTELNGYDDKNYHIKEDPNMKNPLITDPSPEGYVLKIMNSMDSENLSVVEAQNEIMNFLATRSVRCPTPVRNVYGHLYSVEGVGARRHAVRLLRYVGGALLRDAPHTDALLYQLGEFVANLDNKLQHFNHSGVARRRHAWMLSSVPELDRFKYVITDADQLDLVEEVIEEFKYAVVPRLPELASGVIHGDLNEMNLLVAPKPASKGEYTISGVLDFGDVQHAPLVCELAVAMAYAVLRAGTPRAAGLVLAGYSVSRALPDQEYRLLKTLVSARLVQSLVLGAYTRSRDPDNAYVSSTERGGGWRLLRELRKTDYSSEETDPTDWKAIANEYLTRS